MWPPRRINCLAYLALLSVVFVISCDDSNNANDFGGRPYKCTDICFQTCFQTCSGSRDALAINRIKEPYVSGELVVGATRLCATIMNLEREEFLKVDTSFSNKANGYYPRMVRVVNHYFCLKIPRDRLSLFKPVFLDAVREYDEQLSELAFYTEGLTNRDITKILRDVFGKRLSASSVSNITKEFTVTLQAWLSREIDSEYYFLYVDAMYIPTHRDTVEQEAYYIVLGLKKDLTREIPVESAFGWESVFADLKLRGLKQTLMVVSDGIGGMKDAVQRQFPRQEYKSASFIR